MSKVTLSYKYILPEDPSSSMENSLPQDDVVYFEWALKKWSHCSKPCGGGTLHKKLNINVFEQCCLSRVCMAVCFSPLQVNSIRDLAAAESQMAKWCTVHSVPTSPNPVPSVEPVTSNSAPSPCKHYYLGSN